MSCFAVYIGIVSLTHLSFFFHTILTFLRSAVCCSDKQGLKPTKTSINCKLVETFVHYLGPSKDTKSEQIMIHQRDGRDRNKFMDSKANAVVKHEMGNKEILIIMYIRTKNSSNDKS